MNAQRGGVVLRRGRGLVCAARAVFAAVGFFLALAGCEPTGEPEAVRLRTWEDIRRSSPADPGLPAGLLVELLAGRDHMVWFDPASHPPTISWEVTAATKWLGRHLRSSALPGEESDGRAVLPAENVDRQRIRRKLVALIEGLQEAIGISYRNLRDAEVPGFVPASTVWMRESALEGQLPAPAEFSDPGPQWVFTKERALVRTGEVLDVAVVDLEPGGRGFIACAGSSPQERVFTRDGRLFLDAERYLATVHGRLAGALEPVPENTRSLEILADGRVFALRKEDSGVLAQQPLGQIELYAFAEVSALAGNGRRFHLRDPEKDGGKLDQDGTLVALKSRYLELPEVDTEAERRCLGRLLASRRLAEALLDRLLVLQLFEESCRSRPGEVVVVLPGPPPDAAPPEKPEPLIIYEYLPQTLEYLSKALKKDAEQSLAPSRFTYRYQHQNEAAEALTRTLHALRRRMAIIEKNLAHAEYVEEKQDKEGNKIAVPYRRRLLVYGPSGELIEKEADLKTDPFRVPPQEHPLWKRGFKEPLLPNVQVEQERLQLKETAKEHELLRRALDRLAPHIVFPEYQPEAEK